MKKLFIVFGLVLLFSSCANFEGKDCHSCVTVTERHTTVNSVTTIVEENKVPNVLCDDEYQFGVFNIEWTTIYSDPDSTVEIKTFDRCKI